VCVCLLVSVYRMPKFRKEICFEFSKYVTNSICEYINVINKNIEVLLQASRKVVLEINREKTDYMSTVISDYKNGEQNRDLLILKMWQSQNPRVVTGEKNNPTVAHACRKRRLKWVLGAWGYNWATQSPWDINMETWSSRLGVGAQG
jgi:hypothetical protein